jgi:alpha-glucosidase
MWWKFGVIYQIYPRSFKDSNNDGIGDLRGIIGKLDYLNNGTPESLGIDGLWISPFFRSPMKDFGYDIADYRDIDPMFGTLADFKELLAEAHKRNIHIIVDLVLNHSSDLHPWFIESRQNKENPKADWYIWHSGKGGKRPNNWFSQFELQNAWWYEPKRKEFYLGTFTRNQPEVNWRNPELRNEMFDLVRYWLDMGVDGFRLDVVNWFIKDDQFRSNPYTLKSADFQKHIYDRNRPETIDICRQLRSITDQYEGRMLVGEVYTDDPKTASRYCGNGDDALHMAFNFNFLFQPWNARKIYHSINDWYDNLEPGAWPNFTFSNHDNLRHIYRYRLGRWTEARGRVAAALLLTLRGTPFIYYGEEIGMTGSTLRKKDARDPLTRKAWLVKKFRRDMARTPMQWDSSVNAGFSAATPWLPVDAGYLSNNITAQSAVDGSLLNFYKQLIWLRKQHQTLQSGAISFLPEYLPNLLVFLREDDLGKILVILNFTQKSIQLEKWPGLTASSAGVHSRVLLGTHRKKDSLLMLSEKPIIKPFEVIIAAICEKRKQ